MASDGADAPAPRSGLRRGAVIAGAAAVVLVLDQLSKNWAVTRLTPGTEGIHVVGDLYFRLAFNSGMSFSLGTGMGPVVAVIAVVIIGVLAWLARSIRSLPQLLLVGIVMGGAAGNLCDRIFRAGEGFLGGHVVDFVYVGWWPTFNVADSAIVVGGIVLAMLLTFWPDEPEPTPDAGAPPDEGSTDVGSTDVAAPGTEEAGTGPR